MDGLLKHSNIDRNNTLIIWSPFLVFFTMMGIAAYVGGVPASQTVLLIASHIAFMLVPGVALVSNLRLHWKSSVSFLSISYFSGYCLCIIAYIVFLMLGVQAYSWIYGIVAFLAVVVVSLKGKVSIHNQYDQAEGWSIVGLLVVGFVIVFITYIDAYRSPLVIGYQNIYQDNMYWLKNSVAVTKGYPLPELSVFGLHLYWHIFSNFTVAFLHFTTGMEISDLCFISCVWQIFVLVMGTYTIFMENSKLDIVSICCAVIILTFTQGNADKTGATYLTHFYLCALGCSDGQAAAMFCFVALSKTLYKTNNLSCYIWLMLLFICTLGFKAPYGCILLVGICTVYFCKFFKVERSRRVSEIIKIAVFVFVFFLINQLFIIDDNALTSQTSIHRLAFSPIDSLFRGRLGQYILSFLSDSNLFIKCIAYPITMVIYYFSANGIVVLIFVIAAICLIANKKWDIFLDISNMALFVMTIVGVGIFQFVSHRGFSQVYFLFISFPFALLWSINILASLDNRQLQNIWKIDLQKLLCIMTLLAVIYTAVDAKNIFNTGIKSYRIINFNAKSTGALDFTNGDVLGLRWIRDNLSPDAVITTNKLLAPNGSITFVTSAYSERQVFLEGYAYANIPNKEYVNRRIEILKRFYTGDISSVIDLANEGVDYAVLFKFIEHYNVVPSGLPLVYENDDISVYKIK